MGILSEFGIFSTDDIDLHSSIVDPPMRKLMRGVNALREHILDVAPVGIATRTFKGHDHADSGPPLNRGCLCCEDNGNEPMWIFKPTGANAYLRIDTALNGIGNDPYMRTDTATMTQYVSPKLPSDGRLRGYVWYTATNGNFKLKLVEIYGNAQVEVDLPEASDQTEVPFVFGFAPKRWNDVYWFAQADNYNAATPPELKIFAYSFFETIDATLPQPQHQDPL